MNELGMWIKENTTRREFAKLIGVQYQVVMRMCGKYGVSENHIDAVSAITKIPRARLRRTEGKGKALSNGPKFDGAYWTDVD